MLSSSPVHRDQLYQMNPPLPWRIPTREYRYDTVISPEQIREPERLEESGGLRSKWLWFVLQAVARGIVSRSQSDWLFPRMRIQAQSAYYLPRSSPRDA